MAAPHIGQEAVAASTSEDRRVRRLEQELDRLRRRLAEAERELAEERERCAALAESCQKSEEALRKYSEDLEERMKELRCLYGISNIIEQRDLTLEEILIRAADVIPPGWRHVDIARARIRLFGQDYPSGDFAESPWRQSAAIFVHGERAGSLDVFYLEQRPDRDEGPFLKEERDLIDALAERLGRVAERKGMEEALRESMERYRLIYDYTGEAIYTYDTEFVLIGVNRKACEFIGYAEDELVGRNIMELGILHPDDYERTLEDIARLFRGEVVNDELRFVKKDGSVAIGSVTGAPLFDKEGKIIAFTNVARDITEAKQVELALLASEDRFRSIVEQSHDGIVLVDREGIVVGWNQAQADIVGLSRGEALGKHLWDLQFSLAPEERRTEHAYERLRELVLQPLESGHADWFGEKREHEIWRPDGQRRTIEAVTFPIQTYEGFMMCSITRDITEQKLAEKELMRINRELDAYAHVVSHDLRGPISIIISASDALREMIRAPMHEGSVEQAGRAVEIIRSSSETAQRLVEDLLSLAQAGQRPERPVEVDVGKVVRQVLAERSVSISGKNMRVEVDDDLGHVVADPVHIYQLFSNLVANAVKYNDSPDPRLVIRYRGLGGGVHRYTVEDNGAGIPPEDRERVFLPLVKGRGGGAGVGLAIVKKVVEVYGGTIGIAGGEGARFEITLQDSSIM
ncbi:MAG: PAS domain S-box protein [Actinomycetota bacterium]